MTGIVGKPRVGYELTDLVGWLENFLGWNRPKDAVLAGAGSLGRALLGYKEFHTHGMEIIALFDIDARKIGPRIHGRHIEPISLLPSFVRRTRTPLIATPVDAAQVAADLMVVGGIRAIWNFAPTHIKVSEPVILQNEDFYYSLASSSFKLERKGIPVNKGRKEV